MHFINTLYIIRMWNNELPKIFYRGQCLEAAFCLAGFADLGTQPWFKGENLSELCERLNLKLHTQESSSPIEVGIPVIAVYLTPNGAHAEYSPDLGPIIERGEKLVAVIEIPKKINSPTDVV